MIGGAAWMVSMRWVIRSIGLVSTVILARLLAPEDFGLIAMSMLFIAFVDILTSFGVDMALIQRQDASDDHYNSAWTLKILQTSFVTLAVFFIAPFSAEYFNEPRVVDLMYVLAFTIFLSGFENIGVVAFRKDLEFSKEFKYRVIAKLGTFVVTMGLAFTLKSYWALAFGMVFGKLLLVVLSYWLHSYRPRICFKKMKDIWSFSQWMLLRNIGMYVRKKTDAFLVGHFFTATQMGHYTVGKEMAEMPTTELVWPMARALFPGYAKIAHNPERLGKAYLNVLNTVAVIALPLGVGVALVADPLIRIILGNQWLDIIPIIPWLAGYSVALTLSSSVQSILMAINRMKLLVVLVWTQAIIAVPAIYWAASQQELVYIGYAQFATSILVMPLFFQCLIHLSLIKWSDVVVALWRPLLAATLMGFSIYGFDSLLQTNLYLDLVLNIILGSLVFTTVLTVLWILSGRPDGGESVILHGAAKKIPMLKHVVGAR